MFVYTIAVGWTDRRPVVPDQKISFVRIAADTDTNARLLASQMVASRPGVEMVTRSDILDILI